MKKHLDSYIEYLQSTKSASENTVRNYRYDLQRFINFLESKELSLKDVNFEVLDKFLSGSQKNETKNRWLSAIHSLYEYLYKRKKIDWSKDDWESRIRDYGVLPVSAIYPITSEDLPTPEERKKLIAGITSAQFRFLKHDPEQAILILHLISSSSARPSEVLRLRIENVAGSDGNYTNPVPRKWKYVGRLRVDKETKFALDDFINNRIKEINGRGGRIFEWNYSQWYYRFRKIREMAGIEKNITSKVFRHLWFTIAELKNMKITLRLDGGGLTTTRMLPRYSHLNEEEKSKEYNRVFGKGVFRGVLR